MFLTNNCKIIKLKKILVGNGIGEEWIKRPGRKNKRKKHFLGPESR
jgi:hypothetical protein